MNVSFAHCVVGRGPTGGADRVAIFDARDRLVIAVADGAGGTGSAASAADIAVRQVRQRLDASGSLEPQAVVRAADVAIRAAATGGQATLVVVIIDSSGVRGASVGDSEAWIILDARVSRLTERQQRKPLLGSGEALVVPFRAAPLDGTLIVGSDGLFKYTSAARIVAAVAFPETAEIPDRLVDLVRLRSGGLQDDVAVVVCRPVREPR